MSCDDSTLRWKDSVFVGPSLLDEADVVFVAADVVVLRRPWDELEVGIAIFLVVTPNQRRHPWRRRRRRGSIPSRRGMWPQRRPPDIADDHAAAAAVDSRRADGGRSAAAAVSASGRP